jgi:hypothetical protein
MIMMLIHCARTPVPAGGWSLYAALVEIEFNYVANRCSCDLEQPLGIECIDQALPPPAGTSFYSQHKQSIMAHAHGVYVFSSACTEQAGCSQKVTAGVHVDRMCGTQDSDEPKARYQSSEADLRNFPGDKGS